MSGGSAEEKKHRPSDQRIRQLAREGQIAASQEFRSAGSFAIAIVAVIATAEMWVDGASKMFTHDVTEELRNWLPYLAATFGCIAVPLFFVIGIGSLFPYVFAAIDGKGVKINAKRVRLQFTRLNPAQGVKERFSLQAGVDALRNLVKTVMILAVCSSVVIWRMEELFWSPACGLACVGSVGSRILIEMCAATALILLALGVADLWISRALFRHQNRMTDSEVKRERKDDFGSPELRNRRSELRQEASQAPAVGSLGAASLVIVGSGGAAALRFDRTVDAPPCVGAKRFGEEGRALVSSARLIGKPVIVNNEAFVAIARVRTGDNIPEEAFGLVAQCFRAAGLI